MFVSVYPRGRAILLLYVDDIKLTGDYSVTISLIKCRLHQLFAMKALTRPKPFLGLEVAHSPRGNASNRTGLPPPARLTTPS